MSYFFLNCLSLIFKLHPMASTPCFEIFLLNDVTLDGRASCQRHAKLKLANWVCRFYHMPEVIFFWFDCLISSQMKCKCLSETLLMFHWQFRSLHTFWTMCNVYALYPSYTLFELKIKKSVLAQNTNYLAILVDNGVIWTYTCTPCKPKLLLRAHWNQSKLLSHCCFVTCRISRLAVQVVSRMHKAFKFRPLPTPDTVVCPHIHSMSHFKLESTNTHKTTPQARKNHAYRHQGSLQTHMHIKKLNI